MVLLGEEIDQRAQGATSLRRWRCGLGHLEGAWRPILRRMPNSETAEGGHPTDEDIVSKMSKMLGTAARLHEVCLGFRDGQECPSYGRRFLLAKNSKNSKSAGIKEIDFFESGRREPVRVLAVITKLLACNKIRFGQ